MDLTNYLDETLCGLLMLKMFFSENRKQILFKIKGSLFGEETHNEHEFNAAVSLSQGDLLKDSSGIIQLTIKLDELDITQGKVLFRITENDDGIISASFERWDLDCDNEDLPESENSQE